MRTSLLVLVRWRGDVIATHNVEQGRSVQSLDFLEGFASTPDVRVEMYDVTAERAALGRRFAPKLDLRAAYAFLVSGMLHAEVAAIVLLTLFLRQEGVQIEADDANRKAATVQADMQVAADEGADAGAIDPPKNQEATADPKPEDVAPAEDDRPAPPEMADESASTEPQGAPAQEEGSEAPGSGGTDSLTASPATCVKVHVPKAQGKMCTRTVVVSRIEVSAGCFVDTIMHSGQTGTLTFPCEGDGEARLTFGKKSFAGASLGGKLDMCAGTEYPFSDGCRWTSAQRVTGRLATRSLSFNYGEAPKVGQSARSCASACSATATVSLK